MKGWLAFAFVKLVPSLDNRQAAARFTARFIALLLCISMAQLAFKAWDIYTATLNVAALDTCLLSAIALCVMVQFVES